MLVFFILFVPLFVLILLGVHMLVTTSNPDAAKVSPYECGMNSVSDARQKFQVSFFLVALLFIVFDLEILFLYPLAVSLYHISLLGFWIAMVFVLIITVGFIYELASNVLDYAKTPSSKITPPQERSSLQGPALGPTALPLCLPGPGIAKLLMNALYMGDSGCTLLLPKLYW
jgi:NADH:ubiquinone oxidoreductase subunit 3 (subunit A)